MSGICGFIGEVKNKKKTEKRMTDAISHRGQGGRGFYEGKELTVGLCADTEEQPVYNEDRTMVLVLDGRIYNSRELREELADEGHVFSTKEDAEVILHGFEQWGEDVLHKLRGMFAFALYNESEKTLFMARDPFGIKPLYYTIINRDIAFASEIKSIMKYPKLERRLNVNALDSFLSFGYVVPPETFFEGVYALLPGHILWCKNGEVATDRYFEARFKPQERLLEEDAVSKVSEAVRDSATVHKGSGSDVGCFLSGGVDSGYLSTYFAGHKTFSVSFEGEVSAAKIVSEEAETEHYNEVISEADFWEAVPKVQKLMGEPIADPSAMAVYFTSRLASKYVSAAVSGEGADELFGGYEAYRAPDRYRVYHKVPYGVRKLLTKIVTKLPETKAKDFIVKGTHPLEDEYRGNGALCTNEEKWALMKDPANATRAQATAKRYFYRVRKSDELTRMQYLDINMWLAGAVLSRADRMSMASSLELRFPYLDKEVYRVASSLPSEFRATKDNTKIVLRKAAALKLTTSNLPSTEHYVPVDKWLREDSCCEKLREEFRSPTAQKYFNIDVLLGWLDDHYFGEADYSRQIWAVYSFLIWYRQYFEEITSEEITEDAIAEVEAIAEEDTAASAMGAIDPERLDELFGLAFDEHNGAGVEESLSAESDSDTENTAEKT